MISYKTELNSIVDFDAWSGGRDTLNKVVELDRVDELDTLIQDLQDCDSQGWTDTQLNDFLWFGLPEMDDWKHMWDNEPETDETND